MQRILLLLFTSIFFWSGSAFAQDEPVRSIVNVTGDLYRFQENNYYGVFLVTDEGIILADPISHDNAVWLKAELDERFGVPVKYVIYSHDHAEHISGGEVFADTATFVSESLAKHKIEESGHAVVPTKLVRSFNSIKLGGKTVELYHFSYGHSKTHLTILFPEESAVFLVDIASPQIPNKENQTDFYLPGALEYIREVAVLEFDIFIPGHGDVGTKEDLIDYGLYQLSMTWEVFKAIGRGVPRDEITQLNFPYLSDKYGSEEWHKQTVLNVYDGFILFRQMMDVRPERLNKEVVTFPSNAMRMGFYGWVMLVYDIDADGKVQNLKAIDSHAESNTKGITDGSRAKRQFERAALKLIGKYVYETNKPANEMIAFVSFDYGHVRDNGNGEYALERVLNMNSVMSSGGRPRQ